MSAAPKKDETPLMKQYYSIKAKHPDAILLFRVGDFYETFEEDAVRTAGILGITLTKRANGAASFVDLAGFPYHALDTYLPRLVRAGMRVAICEQLEDPKQTKTIVKRGITELVTPGVALNDQILEHNENNFLASVFIDKLQLGISFLDISTGEFLLSEGDAEYIEKLLQSFKPKEVLYERGQKENFLGLFGPRFNVFPLDEWVFTLENANERLLNHFRVKNLKGFGVHEMQHGIVAAGAILNYLQITEHRNIGHINSLSRIDRNMYVWLDKFTVRNLELIGSMNEGGKSLLDILDRTSSAMGGRLMRRWLGLPLLNRRQIEERHEAVGFFMQQRDDAEKLKAEISGIGDLERLISKVAALRVSPREMVQLRLSLKAVAEIKLLASQCENSVLQRIADQLNPCTEIYKRLERELLDDAPHIISKGKVIAAGVSDELDELRNITTSGKDYLLQMQQREIENTGISSLRIGFNNVFGYYFEVRNTHKDKVPEAWVRKQTLVSAERYITEELKEYETKILGAEEKILEIETRLFNDIVLNTGEYVSIVQLNAGLVARIDCLLSFAAVALQNRYCCPAMNDSLIIDIRQGRHPVIEKLLPDGEVYISNDVYLDPADQQIMMITGPNMSGKSALLRQTALICLMGQAGSYVPAHSATLGVVDKVFTRVGASDNISMGESTFMVEMNEAASILNNLSERSLVLLDEIGRGTSTYDGVSIAWAIAEFLHENTKAHAKTLFATHYHELNEMEKTFRRIRNYNVSVKEAGNKVIFMRTLKPGGSAHSFGIHVAEMAGMPRSVVERASQILTQLEGSRDQSQLSKPTEKIAKSREGYQLSFFQLEDPVLKQIRDEIKNLDINALTPLEALNKL
ncbi:MAG TPA: DNA mismatch repair protein MutS, partial [Bacteroidales bacterium]|nr:DNA mismatch repair protein MutS [Bacteroidales bacterium]